MECFHGNGLQNLNSALIFEITTPKKTNRRQTMAPGVFPEIFRQIERDIDLFSNPTIFFTKESSPSNLAKGGSVCSRKWLSGQCVTPCKTVKDSFVRTSLGPASGRNRVPLQHGSAPSALKDKFRRNIMELGQEVLKRAIYRIVRLRCPERCLFQTVLP